MITYAKAGGPPDDWRHMKVFDLTTGEEVEYVIECDVSQCWLIKYDFDEEGVQCGKIKVEGHYEIRKYDDQGVRRD